MVIAITPLVVCIIGLLIYVLSTTNLKLTQIGLVMFACGLLAFLLGGGVSKILG